MKQPDRDELARVIAPSKNGMLRDLSVVTGERS